MYIYIYVLHKSLAKVGLLGSSFPLPQKTDLKKLHQETPSPYPPAPTNSHCHSILLDPNPGVAAEKNYRERLGWRGKGWRHLLFGNVYLSIGKSIASVLHRKNFGFRTRKRTNNWTDSETMWHHQHQQSRSMKLNPLMDALVSEIVNTFPFSWRTNRVTWSPFGTKEKNGGNVAWMWIKKNTKK